ncbi:hypothetical protein Sez_0485 [Streptococcus equi subsp. zooepidemicus MGCS10565]|uniref:Uncharacterized protein n=1 Tax=Streptococcus equi subsp. zooepidemicus (strain MGCS10565) TaxID=552526 RepID=B4U1J0_STREM|nr:hypothetical protein Sez_0485 [Streptococcus equi subsp. zooepidemicus MGCS10565]
MISSFYFLYLTAGTNQRLAKAWLVRWDNLAYGWLLNSFSKKKTASIATYT